MGSIARLAAQPVVQPVCMLLAAQVAGRAGRRKLSPISLNEPWEARSRLYRRRFLQPNTHWKALNEIYKFYNLLETEIFKFSILKHFKNLQKFENSAEKRNFWTKNALFRQENAVFATENGQKSDSVKQKPKVL